MRAAAEVRAAKAAMVRVENCILKSWLCWLDLIVLRRLGVVWMRWCLEDWTL